ncbi:MAG: alternative ribosome rescue aminoacyl-tRNA hydrolase ArfB [Cytophagaceae bacterium]
MKRAEDIEPELVFSASRSSGPGGQNVNKVNSKVTLSFDVPNSQILSEEEKEKILKALETKLTKEGVLLINASEKRSQLQNKELAIAKLDKLLTKAFEKRKKRKATRVPASVKKARIESKKKVGEKKKLRKPPMI